MLWLVVLIGLAFWLVFASPPNSILGPDESSITLDAGGQVAGLALRFGIWLRRVAVRMAGLALAACLMQYSFLSS
jgi:hypothetical protein